MTTVSEIDQPLHAVMTSRYAEQNLPWDVELPPPEVLEVVDQLPPGRALDLGCGHGRACRYLAQHGWQCDGVDFVEQAIVTARRRAEDAGVADRVAFHVASVAELDFLEPPYDLAIDVGCFHAQPLAVRVQYATHVARLLKPGGLFLLFAHLREESPGAEGRWATAAQIDELFQHDFSVERTVSGTTTVCDSTWPSGWCWLRRNTE
ncbi:MAG: methyltransferase domain-containing protein [Caldilineaceae bacterium]